MQERERERGILKAECVPIWHCNVFIINERSYFLVSVYSVALGLAAEEGRERGFTGCQGQYHMHRLVPCTLIHLLITFGEESEEKEQGKWGPPHSQCRWIVTATAGRAQRLFKQL